jgi:putative oxidoreductase
MKHLLKHLPVFLLVLLYVYAVTSKLADMNTFRGQLYNQPFPHPMADLLLFTLPAIELLTIALLFFPRTLRCGLWLSAGLLVVFTGYISLVKLHFWARVPCSCGGILSKMSWTTHLVFNLVFIAINLAAIFIDRREKYRPTGVAENLDQSRHHFFI